MSKTGLITIVIVFAASLLVLIYLALTWDTPGGTTTVTIAPPAASEADGAEPGTSSHNSTQPTNPNRVLPQIRIQSDQQPPQADTPVIAELPVEVVSEPVLDPGAPDSMPETNGPGVRLPPLNASDQFLISELDSIPNGTALLSYLVGEELIRKFVVLVDNIARGELPQNGLPWRALDDEMPVRNIDDNLFVMDSAAHSRFDPVVDAFIALDPDAAMALYRLLSPLFDEAYAELGVPDNFDDTLRQAITNVITTDEVEGPYQLIKPSVMFRYADDSIENLQEVHKQLIRLGPENTAKLKARLQEFLDRL